MGLRRSASLTDLDVPTLSAATTIATTTNTSPTSTASGPRDDEFSEQAGVLNEILVSLLFVLEQILEHVRRVALSREGDHHPLLCVG